MVSGSCDKSFPACRYIATNGSKTRKTKLDIPSIQHFAYREKENTVRLVTYIFLDGSLIGAEATRKRQLCCQKILHSRTTDITALEFQESFCFDNIFQNACCKKKSLRGHSDIKNSNYETRNIVCTKRYFANLERGARNIFRDSFI